MIASSAIIIIDRMIGERSHERLRTCEL